MAERPDPHYEETNDPNNPPRAVLNRNVRRTAVWVYVGPLVALLVFVAIALVYWMGRDPGRDPGDPGTTGTTGEQQQVEPQNQGPDQGGFEPNPRPDSTKDDLEFRSGTDAR